MGTLEKSRTISICSSTFLGKTRSRALNVSNKIHPGFWIIDSGAIDGITYNSKKYISYTPSPSNRKIIIANGTSTTIVGQGNVHINQYFTLKNVLHVPKLFTYLVSTYKLTKDLNCFVVYYPSHCAFQGMYTKKRIRSAKEKDEQERFIFVHYFFILPCQIKTRSGFII